MKSPILLLAALLPAVNATAGTPEPDLSVALSSGEAIDVTFYSPTIVRVTQYPAGSTRSTESLVVKMAPQDVDVTVTTDGSDIERAASSALEVTVDRRDGAVGISLPGAAGDAQLCTSGATLTPAFYGGVDAYDVDTYFAVHPDRPVYGIGQVMDGRFDRRNSRHHLQNENMFTYSAYFMVPTEGFGVYLDNYSIADFESRDNSLEFNQIGYTSDYYLIYGGTADGIIAGVRELTGHSPILPLWAYGYFQSKERYVTQQESLDVLHRYRSEGIPLDGIIQDWRYWPQYEGTDSLWNCQRFDLERFPDPVAWADSIHAANARLMIVSWPGFGPKTPQYVEQNAKGHIMHFLTWPPESGAEPYDVYSPEARDIYWRYLNDGLFSYIGNDGWWLDSTEPDHIERKESDYDVPTAAGPYRMVKNAYSLMHNTGIAEHQKEANRDKRVVILTRSGHIGQQRLGSITWSGDVVSTWEALANQIPAALNFTLMGIPNWNSDIGGFFAGRWRDGGGTRNPEYQELYTRWLQLGAFSPMMRSHGTELPREIWQFGEPGSYWYEAIADMIRLRYRLLPYIYSTSADVAFNDGTFMRPLVMDFPADSMTYDLGRQYMFGRNILVAPVVEPGVETWSVYLPEGKQWWDFWTDELTDGGHSVDRAVTPDLIPLYIPAGTILPIGPDVQYSGERPWDDLELRIYPGADATFTLYEDEGDNYNYESGASSRITFTWDDRNGTLSISAPDGTFPGQLQERRFRVTIPGRRNAPLTIPYSNAPLTQKIS